MSQTKPGNISTDLCEIFYMLATILEATHLEDPLVQYIYIFDLD